MEVDGVVKDGRIVVAASVKLPEGAHVRVIVEVDGAVEQPYEPQAVSEESVRADLAWATGKRFHP